MSSEEKLRSEILSRYESMYQFAASINMPYSTLDSIFKRGLENASIRNILKICNALEISADALAEGKIESRYPVENASGESEKSVRTVLASRLKECRWSSGLTSVEVGTAIGKSEKTISAWEHGRGQPDADMLFKLCALYKVKDINVFYGMDAPTDILTAEEQNLIAAYRLLNQNGRKLASDTILAIAGNPSMQTE